MIWCDTMKVILEATTEVCEQVTIVIPFNNRLHQLRVSLWLCMLQLSLESKNQIFIEERHKQKVIPLYVRIGRG